MKNPNGFGGVTKLSGNRRKPYRARKTAGWTVDENGKVKQQYITIGYYATRREALQALSDCNAITVASGMTFEQLYKLWSNEKFSAKLSNSAIASYTNAYNILSALHKKKFANLKLAQLQEVIDLSGKNYPTLKKTKSLLEQLYQYAIKNDVCDKDYAQYIDIFKHKASDVEQKHTNFTYAEIDRLWAMDTSNGVSTVLMLIYSGVRISELLNLKKADVHIKERYFNVIASKTEAGIRTVPIAQKVFPFFRSWYERNDNEYLISDNNLQIKYYDYIHHYWQPVMTALGSKHLPHDTRHTTISMLADKDTNKSVIKAIVGHKGAMDLTDRVYTHFDIQKLIDAIDRI